jgi:hypothetical protein
MLPTTVRSYRLMGSDLVSGYNWLLNNAQRAWYFVENPGTEYEMQTNPIPQAMAEPRSYFHFGVRFFSEFDAAAFDNTYGKILYPPYVFW